MKLPLVILILKCLVIHKNVVNGQNLPELLQSAQMQADQLHSFFTSVLLNFRMEVSKILTAINNDSLAHIFNALEKAPMSGNWNSKEQQNSESDLIDIGKQISDCSAQAEKDIQEAIKQFFVIFDPAYDSSLEVLNIVVIQIIEWNQANDPNEILEKVNGILNATRDEFITKTVSKLEERLKELKNSAFLIPSKVSTCVNNVK